MTETNNNQIVISKGWLYGGAIALLVLMNVGLVAYLVFGPKNGPSPNVNPVTPVVVPPEKTLRDLVDPTAADLLADFYHAGATNLAFDKARQGQDEDPTIQTVYEFKLAHQEAFKQFQAVHNLTGLAAINSPIDEAISIQLGSLKEDDLLDDPTLNVRNKLIQTLKNISEEFNPDIASVPLGVYP